MRSSPIFRRRKGESIPAKKFWKRPRREKILIVTSALTLAEVLALRGAKKIAPTPKLKRTVIDFFKNEYIAVQNVTREVAELARDLVWDRGIKPKDAVHVASAIVASVSFFETYDGPLIKKGKKIANIEFRQPPFRTQPDLPLKGGGLSANGKAKKPTEASKERPAT